MRLLNLVCKDVWVARLLRGESGHPSVEALCMVGLKFVDRELEADIPEQYVRLRWPGDSQRESARFARIDSRKEILFFHTLLLLNGLNKDKEVIAPLFKIRRLGLQPLETTCFLGKNSVIALPSASLNKEAATSLSYLSRLAAFSYRASDSRRITANLRFALFGAPKHDSQKRGFGLGTLRRFART